MSALDRIGVCIMGKGNADDIVGAVSARAGWVYLVFGMRTVQLTPEEARAFRRGLSAAIRKAEEPTT